MVAEGSCQHDARWSRRQESNRLLDAVRYLLPIVTASLLDRLTNNVGFRGEITAWAVKQGIGGSPDDPEFAESIARQIIYRLLGKVLFYQTVRSDCD